MPAELTITDPIAVKTLLGEQGLTHIEPYLGEGRSMAEAAAWTGASLQRTFYWTNRLCEIGLVRAESSTPRAGRAIRRYRAVADSFRIRARDLPVGLFASMMDRVNQGLVRSFEAAHPEIVLDSDVWIHRSAPESGIAVERTPGTGGAEPADALQSSFTVRLTVDEAAQLRAELAAVRDRWVGRAEEPSLNHATYLTVLALTPVDGR